jgi:hypothetical protein
VLALAVSTMVMAPLFWWRWVAGEGIVPLLMVAGVGIASVADAMARRWRRLPPMVSMFALAAVTWLMPTVQILDGSIRWRWPDAALLHLTGLPAQEHPLDRAAYGPHVERLAQEVRRRIGDERAIVWSNTAYAGGLVATLAGRAVSSGMLYEVGPARPFDPIAAARVVLWWKMPPLPGQLSLDEVRASYRLELVAGTDAALVFRQPAAESAAPGPHAVVPMWLAAVLLCGVLTVVVIALASPPTDAVASAAERSKD